MSNDDSSERRHLQFRLRPLIHSLTPIVFSLLLTGLFPGTSHSFQLEEKVRKFTLDNGMRVLVLERKQSPTFSAYIRFKVGSVDEQMGETGAAHLLEHMLFKGTPQIGTTDYSKEKPILDQIDRVGQQLDQEIKKGDRADPDQIIELRAKLRDLQKQHKQYVIRDEFAEIYGRNGETGYNAFTSKDTTTYVISLPSNKLELWALVESMRWGDPVLREFYSEREVVLEERRRSYENRAGGKLYENFIASSFIAHPYGKPIIGWDSDIRTLPKDGVEAFLKTYYAPNNAVVSIVGDVQAEEVHRLMKKYFGPLQSQEIPSRVSTMEPPQSGERRIVVEFDANPEVMMGYHKPSMFHPDDLVFDVINAVLSDGRTSRLYKTLVTEKQIAVKVGSFTGPGNRYPNLFAFYGTPRHPHTTQEVEEAVYAELEKLKTEPVSDRDMEKVRNRVQADFIRGLRSNSGMAGQLSYYELIEGDWKSILRYQKELEQVTPDDVMRVAKTYFVPLNRTVATLVKKESPSGTVHE